MRNLDLIYLFSAMSFFFLGTASLVFCFRSKTQNTLAWLWLSLFGFMHSFNESLDMMALVLLSPRFLAIPRCLILSFSFLCLIEFSRRSHNFLQKPRVRPLFYFPLLALLITGFLSKDYAQLTMLIRYALGLMGGIWASCIFWSFSLHKENREFPNVYKGIAILFFLYALTTGLIGPKGNFWPAPFLPQVSFFNLAGIPIAFFRGFLITTIAFIFLHQATGMSWIVRPFEQRSKHIKWILFSFVVLYFVFLHFGFRLVSRAEEHEKEYLKKLIIADAKLLAQALGDLNFDTFAATRKEAVYPTYLKTHSRMLDLAEIATFIKSVYIVSFKNGVPMFAVGSQPQVFPGDVVPSFGVNIPQKTIVDARQSKLPTIHGPYQDAAGHQLFSIFIPLLRQQTQSVSLLGLDLDGLKWQLQIAKARLYVVFIVMAFLVLLIIGYSFLTVFALKNMELEVQKQNLDKALLSLKEAEAELARSEETFRGILNNSPNAIFGFDRDLKIIFWNYGAERLYGYPKQDIVNEKNPILSKKITEIFGVDELGLGAEKIFNGETVKSEMVHHKKEGRLDVMMTLFPVKDPQGHLLFGMGLVQDVSDYKHTLELLKYERALSKNVIDSISEELIVLDCYSKKILDVNREFLDKHHSKKEEVIGRTCWDFIDHASPSCNACQMSEVVQKGRILFFTHLHKDSATGQEIYVDVTLSPLKDEKGKIIGVLHLSKDVTDRKHLEENLRQYSESLEVQVKDRTKAFQKSELMFRRLFESAQDGILIIDMETAKIIDANPFILNLLGFSKEEIIGVDYRSTASLAESGVVGQALDELKNKNSVFYDGVIFKNRNDKEITVEFRASVYDVEKKKIVQCNIRDITERKKLEQVKSEFVSMVSHELRTPLSAIKEGVEIVADGTQGKLNKEQQECLGIALSNIKRLNRLIGDILDISKIQSNLLKINTVSCDVHDAINQVYDLVKIEIEKHGLVFLTDIEKNLPPVMGDKDRIIQILLNLLNNAVKFTREKGKITLSARKTGDFVELVVKDEGAGISSDALSQLFGRFIQLDSTLVRRVGGTGLGLYISRNLVEAMGGKIWAESKLGEGALFKFTVPLKKKSA